MTEKWGEIQGTFELSASSSYRSSTTVLPNQKEGFLSSSLASDLQAFHVFFQYNIDPKWVITPVNP